MENLFNVALKQNSFYSFVQGVPAENITDLAHGIAVYGKKTLEVAQARKSLGIGTEALRPKKGQKVEILIECTTQQASVRFELPKFGKLLEEQTLETIEKHLRFELSSMDEITTALSGAEVTNYIPVHEPKPRKQLTDGEKVKKAKKEYKKAAAEKKSAK